MNAITNTNDADWQAAEQVAERLGMNTRRLVALRDPDEAVAWALRMSREHTGVGSLSYYELAVILGHHDPAVTAGASLDWNELLRAVEKLQAAVRVKMGEKAIAEKATADKAVREEFNVVELHEGKQ